MTKSTLFIVCLLVSACAKPKTVNVPIEKSVSCVETDLAMIPWPDGVSVKASVLQCSDGCTQFQPTNFSEDTPRETLTLCHYNPNR